MYKANHNRIVRLRRISPVASEMSLADLYHKCLLKNDRREFYRYERFIEDKCQIQNRS
jgi:hypothetical protein